MRTLNQIIPTPFPELTLAVKREDLIDPLISGNKYRKLYYNLMAARQSGQQTLLTFGGAYSNHIAAVAEAGKRKHLNTIGIIRGEELALNFHQNPTLAMAHASGMRFWFVDRETYRNKENPEFLQELQQRFGAFYLLPEGGTNALAIRGCAEILGADEQAYDYVCCAVGTGGTFAGLLEAAAPNQHLLGFPVLKEAFLHTEIAKFAPGRPQGTLVRDYHFGGYGKINEVLVRFMNSFRRETGILLDPVYTAKMLYGIYDLAAQGFFPSGSRILAIHTGGLQGIEGMNRVLADKSLPLIETHD